MSKPKLWLRRGLVVALVAVACEQAWRHGHDYVFADQFAVVDAGTIYRGAWQKSWPMRRIIRLEHLRTIIAAWPIRSEHALSVREKAPAAESMGVRWVHILDRRRAADGRGKGDLRPDRAAPPRRSPTRPASRSISTAITE